MVMAKDPTEFRNRFKLYKEGKMPYENGLPKYAEGTEGWLPDYTMDYILALENPTKQGLVDGIWRPPMDSSKWDVNAIGGGLDIRYKNNPLVYNFLSDNNRLSNPYLTEQEEYDLRRRTFNDTMLPALIRMHDKYGEQISSKGYARLAGMKWQGHPFLMAITPDSITGRAFLNAIESGDRDLDTVFNAYYRHPANAKKYAARIQSDENYWSNNHSINLGDIPIQSTLHPIVEKRDAVTVRKTIPKAKTRARWTGAENVSPYLTGKPILKLKKEIKFPTAAEMHKESQWKAPMQFKDGKLPGYKGGKIGHNVSHAEMNNDGTFTDDYTKLFEDMYVTPQKTDLKRGSYTLNNFPYYLQHRTDWMKPFMSSGTNEKGLELVYPEFDILSGARVLQQMSKPFAKIQQTPDIQRKYDNIWDKHYFKALQENDIKGAQNLREAHFRINAPNTKITKPQYHTVDDQYDPKYNSFDKDIENLDASFYTSDNPYVSGTYSKELVSEAERDYIIETTRQQQLKQMLSYRNEQHLTNPHYWELVDPNKFRQYALKTFKWLDTPVNPDRQKKVYLNIKNPFEIDAKGKYWSQFEFEDFPKAMQDIILPNGYSMYRPWSTRSIEAAYPKLGYDSAIIQNLIDLGGNKRYVSKGIPSTIIETKNPNNIKYVDAVTYDDSGNIIPLSERDNFNLNDFRYADGKLPGYKNGKIHIKPANRGKFTALKKRTGHSASWFKAHGTPAQKKMAVFALNAKKWKH